MRGVIALVLLATLGVLLLFPSESRVSPSNIPTAHATPRAERRSQLLHPQDAITEISVEREAVTAVAPREQEPPVVATLGRLPDDQLPDLLSAIGVDATGQGLAKAATKAESGKSWDYRDYLFERYVYEKTVVCERLARQGDYRTVPANSNPQPWPPGLDGLGLVNVGSIDKKRVDVFFSFDTRLPENSAVREAAARLAEFDARPR
jgi:hypothetical protein